MEIVGDALRMGLGLVIIGGFWWGVFAAIRLFEPLLPAHPPRTPPPSVRQARPPESPSSAPAQQLTPRATGARNRPCCPDCAQGCQMTGLAMGQEWGRGDGWWGQPFGQDGPNSEAITFWGDKCCPDCGQCQICRGS